MPSKIAYREVNGKVRRVLVSNRITPKGETRPDRHVSETILKGYYAMEQEKGCRFRSGYSKNQLKRVHETALSRFDELGMES
jgi:hypothetical protein